MEPTQQLPARPHRDEPGTVQEQLAALAYYFRLDPAERRRDPDGCWAAARWATMPHVRRVVR